MIAGEKSVQVFENKGAVALFESAAGELSKPHLKSSLALLLSKVLGDTNRNVEIPDTNQTASDRFSFSFLNAALLLLYSMPLYL